MQFTINNKPTRNPELIGFAMLDLLDSDDSETIEALRVIIEKLKKLEI